MAKGVKTGGRKKGTPNKASAAKAAAVAASGLTPMEFMLQTMRDPGQPLDIRLDAAKSAAPYVHPKLSAVEHTGRGGEALIPAASADDAEVARRLLFVLTRGAHAAEPQTKA
jgi:hypothetical protein